MGGKTVLQGPTVYLCGEGNAGFRKRICACRGRYGITGTLPFYLVEGGPDLRNANSADVCKVMNAIHQAGVEPRAIFVDTLQRHMRGDDSKAEDMSAFCEACQRLAKDYECAVAALHHTPWSDATRGRGSTVLKASIETELLIEGTEGLRTVILKKSRDGEAGLSMTFELERVEFATHGRDYSSVIGPATQAEPLLNEKERCRRESS
jgi:hypothetical protein